MNGLAGILGKLTPASRRLAAAALVVLISFPAFGASPERTAQRRAAYDVQSISTDALHIAEWALHSRDPNGLPFIVVDKLHALAIAFDRDGKWLASTAVLIGMGVGDKFPPGIADMDMYLTTPSQRITPAGRYLAQEGENLQRETVLWVDYDNGIALHKLSSKRTKQRRQERMASGDPAEHRITYGCINVPPSFYDKVVAKHFRQRGGVVYVLPDSTPLASVFKSYEVGESGLTGLRQTAGSANRATVQRF